MSVLGSKVSYGKYLMNEMTFGAVVAAVTPINIV